MADRAAKVASDSVDDIPAMTAPVRRSTPRRQLTHSQLPPLLKARPEHGALAFVLLILLRGPAQAREDG